MPTVYTLDIQAMKQGGGAGGGCGLPSPGSSKPGSPSTTSATTTPCSSPVVRDDPTGVVAQSACYASRCDDASVCSTAPAHDGDCNATNDGNEEEFCWICMLGDNAWADEAAGERCGPLVSNVCGCISSRVHLRCLAKWQLSRLGTKEETHCRVCRQELPEWRDTLLPRDMSSALKGVGQPGMPRTAVMHISYGGQRHSFPVTATRRGLEDFKAHIRRLCNVPSWYEIRFSFSYPDPNGEGTLQLTGINAFYYAVHRAAVDAALEGISATALMEEGSSVTRHNSTSVDDRHTPLSPTSGLRLVKWRSQLSQRLRQVFSRA
eukprot:jgi/Chlat1/4868/Chrsp31S04878